jgi:hypothetical protein
MGAFEQLTLKNPLSFNVREHAETMFERLGSRRK